MKIKSDELNKNGHYQTVEMKEDGETIYSMSANFDNAERTLTINLASKTIVRDEEGQVLDGGKFNIIYRFNIKNDGKLIFSQIFLAG